MCTLSFGEFYVYFQRRQWQPTSVFLPGKSYGQRSLVGCSPWGRMWRVGHDWVTSLSLFTFLHWRRNGNPLQCSCLENPRDRGAWWVAIYGAAQSQTRLKWLSSIFSAAKDGEALYSQQQQDQELTVARSWTAYYQIQTQIEESRENR